MHYQRLLLDDFGLFQRAELTDLEPGLTVIAGPQRAGKTTFMNAVRRLGYGIGQGDDIPPASNDYRLQAEIADGADEYRLTVDGYADPRLTSLAQTDQEGPERTIGDFFGALSKQQYRQLYTLSLDQLKRLPPAIDEPEDLSRVLLGAAYGSLADLPQIRSEFDDLAYDIGRKKGHPRYGAFSDAYDQIEAAQEDLADANEQVAEHDAKRAELSECTEEIDDLDSERDTLSREERRLNVVQQYFEDYHTYRRLGQELDEIDIAPRDAYPEGGLETADSFHEDYQEAIAEVEAAADAFRDGTAANDPAAQRDRLLELEDTIETYRTETAGWRERLRSVHETAEELQAERTEIEREIRQLKDEWTGSFDEVRVIKTDLAERDAVAQAVERVTDARAAVDEAETELEQKRSRLETVDSQFDQLENEGGTGTGWAIATGAGVAGVLVAFGLASIGNPVIGLIVGGILVLGGGAVAYRRRGEGSSDESQRAQLQAQQQSLTQDISELETELETAQSELEAATEQLDTIRDQLGLGDDLSPEGVETFYESVVDLREEIEEYEANHAEYAQERDELVAELTEVGSTVEQVRTLSWTDDGSLDDAESLFAAVGQAASELELATDWAAAIETRDDLEAEIIAFLDRWPIDELSAEQLSEVDPGVIQTALAKTIDEGERVVAAADYRETRREIEQDVHAKFRVEAVRDAFATTYGPDESQSIDEWYLDAFEDSADQFADATGVDRRLNAIGDRKDGIEERKDELQAEQAELRQELEKLASEGDLLDARERIQTGSREIERLGEEYAVYRIAEYMTEQVQDRFIEETTGPLLDDASEIFAQITNDYNGIEQTGELDALDFEVVEDGEPVLGTSELSRATAEQLFLAVRLARIRQIDTSLPVVLDDALTNFDPAHGARTMSLIDELADSHQVFFLTAHPAFVELADEHADVAQFWELSEGRFRGPFNDPDPAITDRLLPQRVQRR